MLNILWYLTVALSIWGSALGGIPIPGVGLMFPFRMLSLLLLLAVVVRHRGLGFLAERKVLRHAVILLVLFLMLYSCVSTAFAISAPKSLSTAVNFLYVLVFAVLFIDFSADRKVLDATLATLSVNLFVIMLFAVFESLSGVYLFANAATVDYSRLTNDLGMKYPAVCFENTNNLAFNIILTLPFTLYLLDHTLKLKRWQRNVLKAAAVALSAFVVLETCSRLGYVAFAAEVLLYFIAYIKKPRVLVASLAVLLAGAVLIIAGFVAASYVDRNTHNLKTMKASSRSILTRVELTQKASIIAKDSWFMGVGPGSIDARMKQMKARSASIHELYAEVLAAYGFVPLVLLLYLQIRAFLISLRMILRRGEDYHLGVACFIGTVVLVPASAMLSSAMFFYILWANLALWSYLIFHHSENSKTKLTAGNADQGDNI